MATSTVETVKQTFGDVISSKLANDVDPAQTALSNAINRFITRNPRSQELHKLATESMPGGNTRTQLHTFPFPVCMKSGEAYQVTSEDAHMYNQSLLNLVIVEAHGTADIQILLES